MFLLLTLLYHIFSMLWLLGKGWGGGVVQEQRAATIIQDSYDTKTIYDRKIGFSYI